MYDIIARSHIDSIHQYIPGKPVEEMNRELGITESLQLASNENVLGPSPMALKALTKEISNAHRYPESGFYYLVERLGRFLNVPTNQIIVGNGSNEIIDLLVRALVNPGEEVVTAERAFAMFKQVTMVNDGRVVEVPQTKDYVFDASAMADAVTDKTKIIFIANPNNPTGTYINRESMDEMFVRLKGKQVLVVLDEAYLEFVDAEDFPASSDYFNTYENVFVMRTFSKAYGLAGLRVGYGFGNPKLVSLLYKIKNTFNVNRLAQVAAKAALDDIAFIKKSRDLVLEGREYLYKELKKLGLRYLPSQANFVMTHVGPNASEIYQALLKKGIVIRPMNMYQLPEWFRITVGTAGDNRRVIAALRELI